MSMELFVCKTIWGAEHPYVAPSWSAAMAMANRDGHGQDVAYWICQSGLRIMMHDSRVNDVTLSE